MRTTAISFTGGEVTPEFYGRIDDAKFRTGLALCRNFVVLPHGPIHNNAGTEFVREVKDSAKRTRLLPFSFSTTQTMLLEFGAGYFRFHTNGATLIDGVSPYEITNSYLETELFDVRFVQSNDVLTLVHPNHPPRELRRLGALSWQLISISFGSTAPAPSDITATATLPTPAPDFTRIYDYLVTGVKDGQESALPLYDSCVNNLDAEGASNSISWTAAPGPVDYYRVYRLQAGVFAFIGQTEFLTFVDEGISPDVSFTPARFQNPFVGPGNYPSAVTYYEQRRVFGGGINRPQTLVMTRSGTESDLATAIPSRDDDAITFRIASLEANSISHLVSLQELLTLTTSAEARVTSDGAALTPSTVGFKFQSYVGAGPAKPQLSNSSLVFAAARGGHVREMGFSNDAGGFITNDLSLRATHLFDGFQLVDSAQTKAPYPILWWTSTSGLLLGLTYMPEQQLAAWHSHDTDGVYESVAVVAEGDEDAMYHIVRREIGGVQKRYIERRASRRFADLTDAFFVDCGVRYEGPPIQTLSAGLSHLEGKTVAILADGAVQPPRPVTGGTLTLDREASKIVIGLPIVADAQSLPFAAEIEGYGQGRPKSINEVFLKLFRSSNVLVGPDFDNLQEAKMRTDEPFGSPPSLFTGEIEVNPDGGWTETGQLCIRQDQPLPLSLLSMSMELAIGG